MIRLLLLGNQGQLGWELHRSLAPLGELVALDQPRLDLTDLESLRAAIRSCHPDVIVNATAYTAVDRAETEPDLAQRVSAHAPQAMAEEALRVQAALVHFSTDFVFNGETNRPYTEADAPDPLSVYGATKFAGEQAIRSLGGANEWGKLVLEFDPRPEEHRVEEVGQAPESEFAAPARLPRYSALECGRFRSTFGLQLPDWRDALRMAMAEA